MCTEATAERILELLKAMPEEEAREVLDFAEFLQVKRHRENEEESAEAKDVLRRIRKRQSLGKR